jgi:hypothetical protein
VSDEKLAGKDFEVRECGWSGIRERLVVEGSVVDWNSFELNSRKLKSTNYGQTPFEKLEATLENIETDETPEDFFIQPPSKSTQSSTIFP